MIVAYIDKKNNIVYYHINAKKTLLVSPSIVLLMTLIATVKSIVTMTIICEKLIFRTIMLYIGRLDAIQSIGRTLYLSLAATESSQSRGLFLPPAPLCGPAPSCPLATTKAPRRRPRELCGGGGCGSSHGRGHEIQTVTITSLQTTT